MKPAAPKKTREDYAQDALYREVWEDVNNDKTIAFFKKYARQMIGGAVVVGVINFAFITVICFITLTICTKAYKKRLEKMEEEVQE